MQIPLSDREASILLGATLMHWGVPFRTVAKHQLTDEQQALVDAASAKLVALRQDYLQTTGGPVRSAALSGPEISLLTEVVADCLAECGDDATELSLQLKTSEGGEVEALVQRLRGFMQP